MGTTSAFSEALAVEQAPQGAECSVGILLREVDADTSGEIRAALDDPGVQHAQISRALKTIGHSISAMTIGRHRRGDCKNCGR